VNVLDGSLPSSYLTEPIDSEERAMKRRMAWFRDFFRQGKVMGDG
jgi:hypothetical protein